MPSTLAHHDPLPFTAEQTNRLLAAVVRELLWGRRAVSRELGRWRARADAIPAGPIREDVLGALGRKRGNIDGAALFWILPRTRNPSLLRLLVAHELIWDVLDSMSERGAAADPSDGRQLHRAVLDALDPRRPPADYYRHLPWRDDGGFLPALVGVCRERIGALPSYGRVQSLALRAAVHADVQGFNHVPDPGRRDRLLRQWVADTYGDRFGLRWFEITGAASGALGIHVLFALAAEPVCDDVAVETTYRAYFPWVSLVATMLDSYVDQEEDRAEGGHSYISRYGNPAVAGMRLREAVARTAEEVTRLPDGHRHAVIFACMVAMYLSKDSARSPELRETTRSIAAAGGSLTQALIPILRLWRVRYGQQAA